MAAPMEKIVCSANTHIFRYLRRCGFDKIYAICDTRSTTLMCVNNRNYCASADTERNPFPYFVREDINKHLRKMTRFDVEKSSAPKQMKVSKPKYRLMDEKQLEEAKRLATRRLKWKLQMPPYLQLQKPISNVLGEDTDLEGLDSAKLVCTDITFGIPDRSRIIVVREPTGQLRTATWQERDRMKHVYNPREGHMIVMPKMFRTSMLKNLLIRKNYTYVLDRSCVQFEPDNEDYIRITHQTYEHIDDLQDYEELRSTRHFGPMAFHLVWNKRIDHLLIDMLQRDYIEDAHGLMKIYVGVHPQSATALEQDLTLDDDADLLKIVKYYCEKESTHKGQLELALQGVETIAATA